MIVTYRQKTGWILSISSQNGRIVCPFGILCIYPIYSKMNILRFDLNKPDSRSVNRLPAGVEGEKSLMMWKELCRTGHYETDGNSHDITPDFFQKMIDSFNARRGKGVEIPVPLGHTHNPEDKRGRVLYLETRKNKQGGFSLWGIIEFLSEEFKEALKNSDVSIDAPEETTDGDGKTWEFTLEHVALTDYPVVAGMEGFKEVKFSVLRDAIMEKWTLDTLIVKLGLTGTYSSPSKVYSAIYRKFQQLTGTDESDDSGGYSDDDEDSEDTKETNVKGAEEMARKKKFSEEDVEDQKDEKEFEDGECTDEDEKKMSKKKKFSKKSKCFEEDESKDEEKDFDNGEDGEDDEKDDDKDFSDDEDEDGGEDEEDEKKMSRKRGKKFSLTGTNAKLLHENRTMKIDELRRRGYLTADQSNEMKRRFCSDRAISFSLSHNSNREFQDTCRILSAGKGQNYGEQTGVQFSMGGKSKSPLQMEMESRYPKQK